MSKAYQSINDTVGNTPLVKINQITEGLEADIYFKCEFFNPLASVKDRIGKAMIEAAEADGKINSDSIIMNLLQAIPVLLLLLFAPQKATNYC